MSADPKATNRAPDPGDPPSGQATAGDAGGAPAGEGTATTGDPKRETRTHRDPVPILVNPPTDVLGRKLPKDPDERRAAARDAALERSRRMEEDVDRVTHGLAPKYNGADDKPTDGGESKGKG